MEIESKVEHGVTILDTWHCDNYTRLYICTIEDAKRYAKMKGFDDSDDICILLHASYVRSKYTDNGKYYYVVEM